MVKIFQKNCRKQQFMASQILPNAEQFLLPQLSNWLTDTARRDLFQDQNSSAKISDAEQREC